MGCYCVVKVDDALQMKGAFGMNRDSIVTGVFVVLMCVAFVLPLVVAPEESDWLDPLTRQLVSFIAVALLALILGDIGENTLGLPILGRICGPIAVGVIFGFLFGVMVELYSGGSQIWLLKQSFVPLWIKSFFATHQLGTTYAPLCGMVVGIAGALWYCWVERKSSP